MTMHTKANRTDICLAAFFLLIGIYLTVSASMLPTAANGLAGPGFFPRAIGVVMVVLGAILLFQGIRSRSNTSFEVRHGATITWIAILTAVYLLLWGIGFFPLRTFIFIVLFLRILGQSWKTGVSVSIVLTAVVTVAFQYGLRLSLD
jgi:hypothetical protein